MLTVQDVQFSYGETQVLEGISLYCTSKETIGIVGRSGSGKTTLLNLLTGYRSASGGRIEIDGHTPWEAARQQSIGYVFQSPTLIPWLTVRDNVLLPLDLRGKRHEESEQVTFAMKQAKISEAQHLFPNQLSGGMRTRASLARAIVSRPRLLLMDEPFSSLDTPIKETIYDDLQAQWQDLSIMSVLVTHDLFEAIRLCDRVYVLQSRGGKASTIVHCENIPFKKPRGLDVLRTKEFQEAEHRVMQLMRAH